MTFSKEYISKLNEDILQYGESHPERYIALITPDMTTSFDSVAQMVMLDRYSNSDLLHETLSEGDFVILTVKEDPQWPARGFGWVKSIDWDNRSALVEVSEKFTHLLEEETNVVKRNLEVIQKPLEIFFEQIAKRNAYGLSQVESTAENQAQSFALFEESIKELNFVPAGRVLYGAGAGTDVTFFNCFVMPFIPDSREGISAHRGKVMEIMSRGGGVGTNGSTLRPKNEVARGVNGKSSGAVSWLNDIANLTNLVEQGGSRRGAQMIMLADWHPDIFEFIVSKMQNPRILQFIIENTEDDYIKELAKNKLKFTPLTETEIVQYDVLADMRVEYEANGNATPAKLEKAIIDAEKKLKDGGSWSVESKDFLSGANISVCLTEDFMKAVEEDSYHSLRFPDVASYTKEQMKFYNENWHEVGDVREWERMGYAVRTYRKVKAKELWQLINICATYSAEPGIFFIDNANDMTNAKAYGQQVVATNPCGEQPLAAWSVCNLAAVNLSKMASFETGQVDWDLLKKTVRVGVRMQDNVIDATPYFLEENKKQALGERRVGLGVMGLHDLLIKCQVGYGTEEGNAVVEEVFQTIAYTAYEESIEIAKEKGSFPFLVGENVEETLKLRMKFVNTGFMRKMPNHIKTAIIDYGIRNSHLLTVAPTGSTGTMVGGSTGLEPYFAFSHFRSGRLGKNIEVKAPIVAEYLEFKGLPLDTPLSELPSFFKGSMDLSPEQHADTQCIIQKYVDSSLSKTVNAPKGYSVRQVQTVYERLWKGGAKGGTVYVDGSRDTQVLTLTSSDNTQPEQNDIPEALLKSVDKYIISVEDKAVATIKVGTDVGNICPICREGTVVDLGGCHSCNNPECGAQLLCGK